MSFPVTVEDFYAARDDRTNRCVSSSTYQATRCAVRLADSAARSVSGQAMLLVAANLLSRWCRDVTIITPDVIMTPARGFGQMNLGDVVLDQMRDADPFGKFRVLADGSVTADITLCIGGHADNIESNSVIFIDASGWLASISLSAAIELPASSERNCLGAIAAACLGVGQIFKIAVGLSAAELLRCGVFDVWSLNWIEGHQSAPWPNNLDVGKVLMVGAGSVGSAFAYCARLAGLSGTLTVVDKDIVKIENFNRSPIFGRSAFGTAKAEAIAVFLHGSGFSATAVQQWWNTFLEERGRSSMDFDAWLPLANEFGVRSSMQHNVPPLMVHASTTSNWGVNHGRHIPGRDDCLVDRFSERIVPDDMACATARVKADNVVIDAALPFASVFAGLLIAADLVRAQLPHYPQVSNFALFDFYGSLESIQSWDRQPRLGCICRTQGGAWHDRFNGSSKYRHLFRFN